MEIKTNGNIEISFQNIISKKVRSGDKEKLMIILIKYIQTVLTNMKYKIMKQILSTVEILIHTLEVFKIETVFWVVVVIAER